VTGSLGETPKSRAAKAVPQPVADEGTFDVLRDRCDQRHEQLGLNGLDLAPETAHENRTRAGVPPKTSSAIPM
jgi:hypothetical protein